MASKLKWKERLARLIAGKNGKFYERAVADAHYSWRTCYIGENRKLLESVGITFDYWGEDPQNERLFKLGAKFGEHVADKQFKKALAVTNTIDRLIAKMQAKQQKQA